MNTTPTTLGLWFVAITAYAQASFDGTDLQACKFAEPPPLPNGIVATESEMVRANGAVKTFVTQIQASLACIDDVEGGLGETITPEQKGTLAALYNNGVDQMNTVAGMFNEQVRAYKTQNTENAE